MKTTTFDWQALNLRFKNAEPQAILEWCVANFSPYLAMTSALQISGIVLIDMIRKIQADFPIIFIDTRFHFPETLAFAQHLKDQGVNIITLQSEISLKEFEEKHTLQLYEKNPDLCCQINKIEPLNRFKQESNYKYWISALRKDQSESRENHELFMTDNQGFIRIHPLINWNWKQVWTYVKDQHLDYHPLYNEGYVSIGCRPQVCTTKGNIEDGERSGRWKESEKTECGLHQELRITN